MTRSQINRLKKLIGTTNVSDRPATLKKYSGDAWYASALPDVVVMPRNTRQIQQLVRFSSRHQIPITPRGAGRGYVGGCVPVKGGILLSLHRMKRILEISAADAVAVVQPGVITADLQQAVREQGLYYPPDPASLKESSIGGNIATNAGGPRCLKYGVTSAYVLGLETVLMNGDIVRTGGRTHKNKVGFKLHDLFIGSEGMLGIITEATLRLIPAPPARAGLVATFPNAKNAVAVVTAIQQAGLIPCALEVADSFTLDAARRYNPSTPKGNAFILTELDGQTTSVKSELKLLKEIVRHHDPIRIQTATNAKAVESLWDMRRDFSYGLRATGLTKLNEDVTVPRGRLLDLFAYAAKLQQQTGMALACFGHAGDGNIHVNIMLPQEQANSPEAHRALDQLFETVISWKGSITGEHGIGLAKKPWWSRAVSPELHRLHCSIKSALDPDNLLNPGKFLNPEDHFEVVMDPSRITSPAPARK
ncbi:MAG: FAD-linked oxidase C-terminal domain-containing protein [Verrucomicrobiota bacterium]